MEQSNSSEEYILPHEFNIGDRVINNNDDIEYIIEIICDNACFIVLPNFKDTNDWGATRGYWELKNNLEPKIKTTKINATEKKALRDNKGKLQWSLVHFKSLGPMVKVLEFEAKKYSRDNWMNENSLDSILDSMQGHVTAVIDGEDIDPESGQLHMGHILCNAMFYIYHLNKQNS